MNVVTIIGVVAACSLVFMAAICLFAEKGIHPFRRLRRKFAKLPFFAKLLVMGFGVTLFVHGSLKSPTNEPPRSVPVVQQITQENVDQGFVLSGITTNSQFSILNSQFATPATTNLKWRLRGAYEDWFALPADGWRFPFRDGWMDEPTICAWGEVRPSIGETNALPPLVPFQVSLAPEANWGTGSFPPSNLSTFSPSIFWHVVTPSNSLVATWQNALVERCPTNLVSFQAEFFADGRFEYRRQDGDSQSVVVESYSPVFPFDYDGDGLENSVDPEPYAAGPDAHGTNAEWYNVVCSNVLDAVEGGVPNEPGITWKEDVVDTAYYFVDIVAERGPAALYFKGNAENNLGDLAIVALTAATNHVPLLMGVDYAVTATADYEIILPDGGFAVISTNSEGVVHVKWPVNFYAMSAGGNAYNVEVLPADPGGEFVWDGAPPMRGGTRSSSSSCVSVASGSYVAFGCGGDCDCGGCHVTGSYRYEGLTFGLPVLQCGCTGGDSPSEPVPTPTEGPVTNSAPSISATARAVIFEDRYENSLGQWVDKRSTSVTITITVEGGTHGGILNIYTENMDKLNRLWGHALPTGFVSIPAGYTMEWIGGYEAVEASESADDIEITASFTPNGSNQTTMADVLNLTSIQAIISADNTGLSNSSTNRHMFGVGETVKCKIIPGNASVSLSGGVEGTWNKGNDGIWQIAVPFKSYAVYDYLLIESGGADFTIPLQSLVPNDVVSISTNLTYSGGTPGHAGFVGLLNKLQILPKTVSFKRLTVREVPATGLAFDSAISGCFTNEIYQGAWYHTTNHGAGVWWKIEYGNLLEGEDVAGWSEEYMPPWAAGQIIWRNPIAWRPIEEKDLDGSADRVFCYKPQTFNSESSGVMRVNKFGHDAQRSPSGDYWLDDVWIEWISRIEKGE